MDSMRNLHKSLPGSTPRHRNNRPMPPEDLLQTFKAAALSVTNLYKRAAEDLSAERQAGYQDAVYDLLSFLDRENIGLETGEGWRVRQWATERQENGPATHFTSDDEEEKEGDREESQVNAEEDAVHQDSTSAEDGSVKESSPDALSHAPLRPETPNFLSRPPRVDTFAFRSSHPYPDAEPDTGSLANNRHATQSRQNSIGRTVRRHAAHQRQPGRPRQLGAGAGSKRKVQLNDFFDLGSLNFGKDIFGSSPKRPRPL